MILLSTLLAIINGTLEPAALAKSPAPISSINTQVVERPKPQESFTEKIRLLRESDEDWELLFENKRVLYRTNKNELKELLKEAHENKLPVQVTVNTDSDTILSVKSPAPTRSEAPSSEALPEASTP